MPGMEGVRGNARCGSYNQPHVLLPTCSDPCARPCAGSPDADAPGGVDAPAALALDALWRRPGPRCAARQADARAFAARPLLRARGGGACSKEWWAVG